MQTLIRVGITVTESLKCPKVLGSPTVIQILTGKYRSEKLDMYMSVYCIKRKLIFAKYLLKLLTLSIYLHFSESVRINLMLIFLLSSQFVTII